MSEFHAAHAVRSGAFTIDLPMKEAFALFEPEGERAWAEGWNPTYLHPEDGAAQAGMVFTTGSAEEATIWTMTRHEPDGGVVEYQRVTPASRTATVVVQCSPMGEGRTRVTVIYTITALTEHGNQWLRDTDEMRFRDYIASWAEAISRARSVVAG
jgi:hypothetical protein